MFCVWQTEKAFVTSVEPPVSKEEEGSKHREKDDNEYDIYMDEDLNEEYEPL